MALNCVSISCKFQSLSLTTSSFTPNSTTSYCPLTFRPLSTSPYSFLVPERASKRNARFNTIVCEAGKKLVADSAAKRARQAEKRRLINKARKSEIKTRMKKALEELEALKKKSDAQRDEVFGIEKLIAEAYSVIDKAVRKGTLHRNTGARRKSRLARRKQAVEIHHGWFTPSVSSPPESSSPVVTA